MSNVIENRYDFSFLFDISNGLPNGDPDNDNRPRINPLTGQCWVTAEALKSKIRKYIRIVKEDALGYRIYIQKGIPLERNDMETLGYLGVEKLEEARETVDNFDIAIRNALCASYVDIRLFGSVAATFNRGSLAGGQITGPCQLEMAESIDPVLVESVLGTRCTVAREEDLQRKSSDFAPRHMIPYGLFRVNGHIDATRAQITNVTEDDLQLFWDALWNMFEFDRSANRNLRARALYIWKHDSKYGNCHAHKLEERIHIEHKPGIETPAKFSDYEITVDTEDLPVGITLIERT